MEADTYGLTQFCPVIGYWPTLEAMETAAKVGKRRTEKARSAPE